MTEHKDYSDLEFAKLDIARYKRRGCSEAVFGECKTAKQLIEIFGEFKKQGQNVLATRVDIEKSVVLKESFPELKYNEVAKTAVLAVNKVEKEGEIAVCTGGTGDIPIAEEAVETAEFYGSNVTKYYDVGVAGIHRLFSNIEEIRKANVIVTVAGMEGALGGIVTGLVDVPVIAVPTSVGYGSSFKGLSALLTMLNSCAEGMTVVNIDNGFGAGYSANRINRLICNGRRR